MLGYLSFPFILIGTISGLAYARIASDRSADLVFNANESTKTPRLLTFVLLNLLAATVFILVILQKILFCDPNSISGNPNISLYSLWPSPFSLFSGYTGNSQGFILQCLFVNWKVCSQCRCILYPCNYHHDTFSSASRMSFCFLVLSSSLNPPFASSTTCSFSSSSSMLPSTWFSTNLCITYTYLS